MLTREFLRQTFHYNPWTGVLTWRQSGRRAGSRSTKRYRHVKIDGKVHREHRLIWKYMTGQEADQVEHDNRIRDDNRWVNLFDVDQTGNQRNRALQANNTSGCAGVTWHIKDRRWAARIKVGKKYVALGSFVDKEVAITVRKMAEVEYGFHDNYGT